MNVYFISGLGADERIFSRLTLPKEWNCVYLDWQKFSENDTVETYARKFLSVIEKTQIEKPNGFTIIGLSFGGMLATELSKILNPASTILISSISKKEQLSPMLKFVRTTNIVRYIPLPLFKITPPFASWYQGVRSSEEKELVSEFIRQASPEFLKWAIHAIANWKNETRPDNLYHIHGDNDRIFPPDRIKADYVIEGGGHIMTFNMADEVTKAIVNVISSIN